jgi:hypothetical protein
MTYVSLPRLPTGALLARSSERRLQRGLSEATCTEPRGAPPTGRPTCRVKRKGRQASREGAPPGKRSGSPKSSDQVRDRAHMREKVELRPIGSAGKQARRRGNGRGGEGHRVEKSVVVAKSLVESVV